VGIDFTLTEFQAMVEGIRPMGSGYAFIVSNKGKVVATPYKEQVNKTVSEALDEARSQAVMQAIEDGKSYAEFMTSPVDGNEISICSNRSSYAELKLHGPSGSPSHAKRSSEPPTNSSI